MKRGLRTACFLAILAVVATLPITAPAAAVSAPAVRLSLAIGHNAGLPGEARLLYAAEDARRMHALLAELGGVAPDRGYLLLNRGPEEVERTLGEIEGRAKEIKRAGKSVELLVFYSGHASAGSLHLGGKPWPMDRLRGFLDRVDADLKITILDACNSGAFITRKGFTLVEPARFHAVDELKTRGSVVLTSSSALEYSHESKSLRGSLFSHYLLSGLRGAADHDRDRSVSLWEAYHFARVHTARHLAGDDGAQNPVFDFSVAGQKDMIMTFLDRGASRIRFEDCPPGTYTLFNRSLSEQWAVVELRAGDTVEVSLPRMEFAVHRVEDRALHAAAADLRYRDAWTLRPGSFRRTWLEDYQGKGGRLRPPMTLEFKLRRMRQPPEEVATQWVPEIGAQVQAGARRAGLHLAWVSNETNHRQRVVRRGPAVGGELGYERFLFPWLSAGPGIRYSALFLDEEATAPLPYPGAAPWPDGGVDIGFFQSLALDLRMRWRPTSRFHLEGGIGIEAFGFWNESGDFEALPNLPLAVGAGYSLW